MLTFIPHQNDSMQSTFAKSKPVSPIVLLSLIGSMAMALGGCGSADLGPPIPAVIEGDSMAPTIPGAHLAVSCDDCGIDFDCELIQQADFTITCPNCGHRDIAVGSARKLAPPSALLRPIAKFPRRWDVVGFKLPDKESAGVKRIVGLPGESIEIVNGDLFSSDRIIRKPWNIQKEIRIPVFDSKYQSLPPFETEKRFRAAAGSGWTISNKLRFDVSDKTGDSPVSWLDYVHWRNCKHVGKRDDEFAIDDHYGFNQTSGRNLNRVSDVMLTLDLDFVDPESTFVLAFRRGVQEYLFELKHLFESRRTKEKILFSYFGDGDRKPLCLTSSIDCDSPKAVLEFSSFDRGLQLRLNGTTVFELREDETAAPEKPAESHFADDCLQDFRLGGKSGAFRIDRTRIWRDVYYIAENEKLVADSDSYILLGDNVPRSLDSRNWEKAGISADQILGLVDLLEPEDE